MTPEQMAAEIDRLHEELRQERITSSVARGHLERQAAEVARLRGVIEGVSKWLENEASALREEGLTMWGNEQLLKSRQLRLALHPANTSQPQPVENGGEG